MVRKLTTLIVALVVAIAAMPTLAAFATNGGANLSSVSNLFANGTNRAFKIVVTNQEAGGSNIPLIGQAGGPAVRYIDILLPTNMNGAACALTGAAADNWNCINRTFPGNQNYIVLQAKSGYAGLPGGQSVTIDFTANINAPNGVSRADTYQVRTANGDNDVEVADGNLTQTVRGLELGAIIVIDDLRTTAPVDTRFTSGQKFHASFLVTNRSQTAITVAPNLTSGSYARTLIYKGGANDFDPANPSIPSGEFRVVTYEVDTSGLASGQAVQQLQASATGTSSASGINTQQSGPAVRIAANGAINTLTDIANVTIEAPADLRFTSEQNARDSVRVGNGEEDTNLVPAGPTQISITAQKAQLPGVTLAAANPNPASGGIPTEGSYVKFTVGNCPTGLTCPTVYGALAAVDDGPRALPRTGGGNTNVKLTYQVDFTPLAAVSSGNLLDLNAEFPFEGVDDNIFDFEDLLTLDNIVQIDALAPYFELDPPTGPGYDDDDDPTNGTITDRVKDGDEVRLTGRVTHTNDLADLEARLCSSQPGSDGEFYCEVVVTEDDLGGTTDNGNGTYTQAFDVTVQLPGEAQHEDGEDTFVLGFGGLLTLEFSGYAEDDATNRSSGVSSTGLPTDLRMDVDNDHADIVPEVPFPTGVPGETEMKKLGYYIQDDAYGPDSVVRLTWNPGLFGDVVVGGCLPNMWELSGTSAEVSEVLWYDGSTCVEGQKPPTFDPFNAPAGSTANDRVLVLSEEIDPALNTINFAFVPDGGDLAFLLGTDQVTDDVLNEAYQQDGRIVDANTPPLPLLIDVERFDTRDGQDYETAGVSNDDAGTPGDSADDFSLFHLNVNDLRFDITGSSFKGGWDDLEIVEITDPANFSPINTNPLTYDRIARLQSAPNDNGFYDLDQADVALGTCGDDCQVRSIRAFRFIRRVPGAGGIETDINGPFIRADFLFDTQAIAPNDAALTIGTSSDGDDLVTINFGGNGSGISANNGNTIATFYGLPFEWNATRVLGGNSGEDTQYAVHTAQRVTQQGNSILMEIDYADQNTADYYSTDYWKIDFDRDIEDLAGNLVADQYRILANNTIDYGPF